MLDVLVVDDDPTALEHIRSILAGRARLRFARSGDAALALAVAERPDLVLLDLEMDGIDGLEVCRRMHLHPGLASVPVMVITARADEERQLDALAAGAVDFISKPLVPSQLRVRVAAHGARAAAVADALDRSADDRRLRPLVLVVDDDPVSVDLVVRSLQELDVEIVVSTDGDDAVRQMDVHRPDAMVLDVLLPGRDGLAVAAEVGRRRQGGVPIVFHTVLADDDLEERAFASGGTDVVRKPCSSRVLSARVRSALHHRRQLERHAAARTEADAERRSLALMAGFVGHELASPLSVVLATTELLARRELDDDLQAHVARLQTAARAACSMVDDLIALGATASGRFQVAAEPVRVAPVVREVVEHLRPDAEAHGVVLRLAPGPDAALVVGDARRLRQCAVNVIGNALKFTPAGGTVDVRWGPQGDSVRIDVVDSGAGLTAAELAQLFRPYERLERDARVPGTGLGLAITKRLMEAMGGAVRATANAPAPGCTFSLFLQRADGDER